MRTRTYRIASATVSGDELGFTFSDGVGGSIPLSQVSPRRGSADWSRLAIQMKGAHIAVPVSGSDDELHEIPWDVLRAFCDSGFSGFSADQAQASKR